MADASVKVVRSSATYYRFGQCGQKGLMAKDLGGRLCIQKSIMQHPPLAVTHCSALNAKVLERSADKTKGFSFKKQNCCFRQLSPFL